MLLLPSPSPKERSWRLDPISKGEGGCYAEREGGVLGLEVYDKFYFNLRIKIQF
jgi:hypothetical protein